MGSAVRGASKTDVVVHGLPIGPEFAGVSAGSGIVSRALCSIKYISISVLSLTDISGSIGGMVLTKVFSVQVQTQVCEASCSIGFKAAFFLQRPKLAFRRGVGLSLGSLALTEIRV